ncbi:MAG: sigma-70 family RNA polymerase sigma factor [Anaeromyxobacter sp.]|nr:sigma-70 family RNA polymerase sigma factor [Anaeromyxobacter sp.]MBL0277336.1 sigma-70 family RNA polymerase sigma factor [Anaeromyxobacter sp.]
MTDQNGRAAALYRQYGPIVYRRCLRILKDPEAAKDATQEVFVKLVRDMSKLEDRETVLPWIYRVATNYCLNSRRNAVRRGEDFAVPDLDLADGTSPDALPSRTLARQVLSQFDETTQTVAVGVLVDGMEHEEVAELLGISRRTVARKLERFLDTARAYLSRS